MVPLRRWKGALSGNRVAPKKIRMNKFCIEYCIRNAGYLHFLLKSYRNEEIQLFSAKLHWHFLSTLRWMRSLAPEECNLCMKSLFLRTFATCMMNLREDTSRWSKFKEEPLSPLLVKCLVGEAEMHQVNILWPFWVLFVDQIFYAFFWSHWCLVLPTMKGKHFINQNKSYPSLSRDQEHSQSADSLSCGSLNLSEVRLHTVQMFQQSLAGPHLL